MSDLLGEILAAKRTEVAAAKGRCSEREMEAHARAAPAGAHAFLRALREAPAPRIIAEIKRRSPSRGELRADFDAEALASAYQAGGAAALSVLTDEAYFGGCLEALCRARAAAPLPVLRKDFIIDPYQVDEAWRYGADALLLIVAALDDAGLAKLLARTRGYGMDALVEVHDEAELERALRAGADLLGVNNRDLRSFHTDLAVTERLAPRIPGGVVFVSESGIFTHGDIQRLAASGASAFLVGESLVRERDPAGALRRLRGSR